jgi:DNA-binding NtrC family response regulator
MAPENQPLSVEGLGLPEAGSNVQDREFKPVTLEEMERKLILETLEKFGGNRTRASAVLGISLRTMRNKIREMRQAGIPVEDA